MLIRTSLFHQGFTLLGRSSVIFAFLLIILYSSSFWFSYNASYFGLLAVLISLVLTHYLLRAMENDSACKLFSFIWKGKPPVVYSRWLKLEENTFSFGMYKLLYSAIDSVSLSPFGNLIFKSTALSGPLENGGNNPATIVLKLPFSAINLRTQKEFIALLQSKCPQATLSPILNAIPNKPILKSTTYIHIFSVLTLLIVLTDIGHATFEYIELLKRYYLSQKSASEKLFDQAKEYYESAEWLKSHCFRFSLVSPKLLSNSSTAASIYESRSKALWGIGKKSEALSSQIEAAKLAPKSFKINLRLARLYATLGQTEEAKAVIKNLIDKHKHALLPRLYIASLLLKANEKEQAKSLLKEYFASLDIDYFSQPPVWPPAGEDIIHELFMRDDLEFLLSNTNILPKQDSK